MEVKTKDRSQNRYNMGRYFMKLKGVFKKDPTAQIKYPSEQM